MLATLRSFRRPARMLRRHSAAVTLGVLLVAGFSLCKLAIAGVIGSTIDVFDIDGLPGESSGTRDYLGHALYVLVGLITLEAFCRYLARRLIIDCSREIEARLKSDLTSHVSRLPLSWFDRSKTGDLLSRMNQDVELLRFLLGPSVLYGAQVLVMVPGCIYVMMGLSTTVTMTISAAFAVLLVAMLVLMPRMQKYSKAVQEDIGAISQHAQESFGGIHVLLNFARSAVFSRRLDELNERYVTDNMAMTRFRAAIHLIIQFCTNLVLLCVLVFGAFEVIAGRLTTGELFQFLVLMGFLVWPLIASGWILGVFHRARSAADRIEEILQAEPESSAGMTAELRGNLEVKNLTFVYPGEKSPALQDVNFELSTGQKLGLVGTVGSGKSTILHLILRLYDPPAGTVFVDGHDVLELDLTTLRALFAFAPQEPFLFSDTVVDNVRFGLPPEQRDPDSDQVTISDRDAETGEDIDKGHAAVIAALRSSALEQDIESLSEGLQTIVGERGVTLSGGQKQRVALARAFVSDRPAVMLDDTLSAVDHQTESDILERLRGSAERRTIILSSHRLSAVRDADLILVMENGHILERGNHASLVARGGQYARAWQLQREGRALGGDS